MLKIADKQFHSRLFTGTGKFANSQLMSQAIKQSGFTACYYGVEKSGYPRSAR
ncbi:thiazole synthase [Vibrio vulnificus]|nr:thiazole synthase [Vibrio vulnificus]